MEENEVVDVAEVIPTSVEEVSQLWTQVQDVVAAWGLKVIAALAIEGIADAEKVFVAGSDADLRNIQYIVQGKQTVDIWKQIKPLAYKTAEIALLLAKNPDKPVTDVVEGYKLINNGFMNVPTIITPVVLVTKDTIDNTVIAGGFFTKEQVYGK